MLRLFWTNDLSVGVAEMDAEHQQLISLMNELLRTSEDPDATPEKVAMSFKKLIAYTETHFSDEERLMGERGYLEIASHKKIHRELMERLQAEFAQCEARTGWSVLSCMKFFEFWLKSHIRGVDKKYGRFFAKKD